MKGTRFTEKDAIFEPFEFGIGHTHQRNRHGQHAVPFVIDVLSDEVNSTCTLYTKTFGLTKEEQGTRVDNNRVSSFTATYPESEPENQVWHRTPPRRLC